MTKDLNPDFISLQQREEALSRLAGKPVALRERVTRFPACCDESEGMSVQEQREFADRFRRPTDESPHR